MGDGRKKLLTVARLWWLTPEKFGRSCRDCVTFIYDELSGRRAPDKTGAREFMMRTKKMGDPPCHECGKTIGLALRHYSVAPDPPTWCYRVFRHWRSMEAVRWNFAQDIDPIVKRNATLFSAVRDAMDRGRAGALIEMLGIIKR